ncbi:Lipopolysaccharide-assembly [compost metagenome]
MKKLPYLICLFLLGSCSYKFNGASIPTEMKTISVKYFENNAAFVDPLLAQDLTEAFKDRIRNQSKLNISDNNPQGRFEGRITEYDIKPVSIQDNNRPVAGANRLTITVSVKYTNSVKGFEKQGFDAQTFTAYTDFSLNGQQLAAIQKDINKKVIDQLTENIFNRAFAQW